MRSLVSCLALAFLVSACGRTNAQGLPGADGQVADGVVSPSDDGGDSGVSAPDGEVLVEDLGPLPVDGGPAQADIPFLVDVPIFVEDTGVLADANLPDADLPVPDSGLPVPDSGLPPEDGGAPDATPGDGAVTPDSGPAPQCMTDMDCGRGGGFNSFCDPSTFQCVRCWNDMQCPNRNVCDTTTNQCLPQCFGMGRCPGGLVCDASNNTCVDCLTNTDCNNGEVCNTTTRSCVVCLSDAECMGRVGQPYCSATSNTCVGCRTNSDCSATQTCDTGTCVTTGARAICEPCTADDQCGGPADLCIGLMQGGTFLDRSCATDCSAMGSTCPNGFSCTSVRGGGNRQCRPDYPMNNPSCTAIRNLGSACVFDAVNVDPGCGIPNRQDARCVLSPMSGQGVCTIFCNSDLDCPNSLVCTAAMTPGATGYCF